jgi:hypothetical protein
MSFVFLFRAIYLVAFFILGKRLFDHYEVKEETLDQAEIKFQTSEFNPNDYNSRNSSSSSLVGETKNLINSTMQNIDGNNTTESDF